MRTMRGDAEQLRRIATNYFYYTAKPHLLNPIHYARIWNERRVYARVRRDFPELFDVIRTTLRAFRKLMPSASIRYYVTKRLTYLVAQRSNLLPAVLADCQRC